MAAVSFYRSAYLFDVAWHLQRRETWRLTESRPTTTRTSEAGAHSASRCDCARSLQAGGNNPEASRTSGPGNRPLSVDSNLAGALPHENLRRQAGRGGEEVDPDRCRRSRRRPSRRSHRHCASRASTKPIYTPHVDCGDNIIVINADKVVFTGPSTTTRSTTGTRAIPAASRSARRARSSRASSPSASSRRRSSACSRAGRCSAS